MKTETLNCISTSELFDGTLLLHQFSETDHELPFGGANFTLVTQRAFKGMLEVAEIKHPGDGATQREYEDWNTIKTKLKGLDPNVYIDLEN